MMRIKLKIFAIIVTLIYLTLPVQAQQPAENFIHTVQPGDTLSLIALNYDLTMIEIASANQLSPPYLIFAGQQLVLPGVPLPTPTPSFSGYSPAPEETPPDANSTPSVESAPFAIGQTHIVQPGETLYSIAQLYDVPPNHIVLANGLTNPDMLQLGQELQIPTGPPPTPALLPLPFESIQLSEPVIIQGRSLVIRVKLSQSLALRGDIDGRPLYFVGDGPEKWTVTSIHALARSNQYPITLIATLPDGREVPTYQSVTVVDGPYGTETIELDEERASLLDPDISMQEWERLVEIWSQVTPQPLWSGSFYYPVDYPSVYITSDFGTRRSYNDGPVTSFHGGTDFGGGTNKAIYAPAAGQVVLAERLNVRGNAVLIDHGLGLFTGYWHQSEIVVQEGQFVQPGDLIGYIGDTGLVTGPHLHWEMRLQGFAVEPLQWVQQAIP